MQKKKSHAKSTEAEPTFHFFLATLNVRYKDDTDAVCTHTVNSLLQTSTPQIHASELQTFTKVAHQRACEELKLEVSQVTHVTVLNIQLLAICSESEFHGTSSAEAEKVEVH